MVYLQTNPAPATPNERRSPLKEALNPTPSIAKSPIVIIGAVLVLIGLAIAIAIVFDGTTPSNAAAPPEQLREAEAPAPDSSIYIDSPAPSYEGNLEGHPADCNFSLSVTNPESAAQTLTIAYYDVEMGLLESEPIKLDSGAIYSALINSVPAYWVSVTNQQGDLILDEAVNLQDCKVMETPAGVGDSQTLERPAPETTVPTTIPGRLV